jgi:hypothetical protein
MPSWDRCPRYPDLPGSEKAVLAVVDAETSLASLRALLRWERRRDQQRKEMIKQLESKIKGIEDKEGLTEQVDSGSRHRDLRATIGRSANRRRQTAADLDGGECCA